MMSKFILISRVTYQSEYYSLSEEEKDKFNRNTAEVMGKFGMELIARYKLITNPSQTINIFQTTSLDKLNEIRSDLESLNYMKYISTEVDIAQKS